MEVLELCGSETGHIWTRRPEPRKRDGFLLSVNNTWVGLTARGRHISFVKVAFGSHGSWFVAGDQLGVVYCFDLARNRYRMVQRLGQPVTALVCCSTQPSEVLVALADYTVKHINIDTCQVQTTLEGHDSCVRALSLHPFGRYLLAVSSSNSILWDLQTSSRCKTLSGGEDVGVQDVFFLPMTNTILTCFKDDSIHGWEADTLEYKFLLPSSSGPTPRYRAFAASSDGQTLAAGGRSRILHLWNVERRRLIEVLQLPAKINIVKQLVFLSNSASVTESQVLAVLSQDGILRFLSISNSCRLLFQLGSQDQVISHAQVGPDARHVAAVSEQGDLLLFDISQLLQQHQIPPAHTELHDLSPISKPLKSSHKKGVLDKREEKKVLGIEDSTRSLAMPALSHDKLLHILKGYGEYPAKYRSLVWRSLLQLPENHTSYSSLLSNGTHPAYTELQARYPIKSRKLLRVLQRVLSCLAHWCPLFSEIDYLPAFVFPFAKLFQNNQLVTFEILATTLVNWCGHWFEYFPNPPLNVLAILENLLAHHGPRLLQHCVQHKITSQVYAWPLLSTAFSEVFARDEWLRLWDNIFSNHPAFLLVVVCAYLSCSRQTLMKCSTAQEFENCLSHHSTVNVDKVIKEAYVMWETTPSKLHPRRQLEGFSPLTTDTYPVFSKYPSFVVDYQLQEREKLRKEEQDYLRQRQRSLEMERLAEQRHHEEEAWQHQQELLLQAEEQRLKMMDREEQRLADQRARLQAMKREASLHELKALDEARKRYLQHQHAVKELELKKMDRDIQKKIVQRDQETHAAIEDVELQTLELQALRSRLERELTQRQEEALYQLRSQHHTHMRSEGQSCGGDSGSQEEEEESRERMQEAQAKLARAQADRSLREAEEVTRLQREVDTLHQLHQQSKLRHEAQKCQVEGAKLETTLRQLQDVEELAGPVSLQQRVVSSDDDDESPRLDTLMWSQRRQELDRQESELLSRVQGLRRKVADQLANSSSSFGYND